jgi:hypothetical protein
LERGALQLQGSAAFGGFYAIKGKLLWQAFMASFYGKL